MDDAQVGMQKAVLWEEAKGKLRAMAAAEGYRGLCEPMTASHRERCTQRWEKVNAAVEKFIDETESNGLNE